MKRILISSSAALFISTSLPRMFGAWAQDIKAGPVTVDTGSNWLDFGFVIVLLVVVTGLAIVYKRWTKE